MSTEYEISSLADFLAVPHEKQAECLRDFETWLNMARQREEADRLLKVMLGSGVAFDTRSFFWIDDGIAGVTALQINEEGDGRTMRLNLPAHKED